MRRVMKKECLRILIGSLMLGIAVPVGMSRNAVAQEAGTNEEQVLDAEEAKLLKSIGKAIGATGNTTESSSAIKPIEPKQAKSAPIIEQVDVVPTTSVATSGLSPKAVYSVKRQNPTVASPVEPLVPTPDVGGLVATITLSGDQEREVVEKKVRPVSKPQVERLERVEKKTVTTIVEQAPTTPDISEKLQRAEQRVKELTEELDQAKMRLMVAETQIERLSKVLEQQNESVIAKYVPGTKPRTVMEPPPPTSRRPIKDPAIRPELPVASSASGSGVNFPIATVIRPVASLYSGPSEMSSKLQEVSSGTILTVEGSQGAWYRVITPDGVRAWVPSAVINFKGGGAPEARGAVNDTGVEDRAMDLWKTRGNE